MNMEIPKKVFHIPTNRYLAIFMILLLPNQRNIVFHKSPSRKDNLKRMKASQLIHKE